MWGFGDPEKKDPGEGERKRGRRRRKSNLGVQGQGTESTITLRSVPAGEEKVCGYKTKRHKMHSHVREGILELKTPRKNLL
jgi:hypothetical protein